MRRPRRSAALAGALRASVTPFLILLTPFAVFVQHHQYGFTRPEIILALLVIAGIALLVGVVARPSPRVEIVAIAALLTWFADIQLQDPGAKHLVLLFAALSAFLWLLREHVRRIVSVMMVTILATSLLPLGRIDASHSLPEGRDAPAAHAASPSKLPLIVHLVLDEHIGVEGLPDGLTPAGFKDEIRAFFVDRGFRLFGGAYSEYASTQRSLSHLLNFVEGRFVPDLAATTGPDTYQLTRNAYFEGLEQQGYTIRAHHAEYLDVCPGRAVAWACRTYQERSLAALHYLPLSSGAKLSVVLSAFLEKSVAMERLKRVYHRGRPWLLNAGIDLPAWTWDRNRISPIATMAAFDAMKADLARSERGQFFFAHLLMPHFPYVYDAECRPRPPGEWRHRRESDEVDSENGDTNTATGRAARYRLYVNQLRCARQKVDELLEAIPAPLRNDAIVVIHGDHGSRIGMVEPNGAREKSFGRSDYADFFSTLFAVRFPGVDAGYDDEVTPITCLLRTLAQSRFTSVASPTACAAPPTVFFYDHSPHVLPDFRTTGARPLTNARLITAQ